MATAAGATARAALSELERGLAETSGDGEDGLLGGSTAPHDASVSLYERFVGDPEDMVLDPQGLRARL